MRLLKKMISAFLVACMVISMLPMVAVATETGSGASASGRIILDQSTFSGYATVWIDGVECAVQNSGESCFVDLPADSEPSSMVTYSFHIGDAADIHTQYPIGMQVWALNKNADGSYTPEKVEELNNILQYSGSSIRITGNKGIRMITSIEQNKKSDLTSGGLAGYKLLEYGTVLAWSSNLAGGNPLVLGRDYAKSNYAYKKGVADPVFAYTGNLMQYTNVLVGFTLDECKDDIAMRPYMILEDEHGEQMTIYGGIVHRSIGYIAWQNKDVFTPGSAAYNYVWEIIRHVYAEVTFQTNGGSPVESIFVEKGAQAQIPANPQREGYTFVGWYKDNALTEAFDGTEPIRENLTLYAKWALASNLSVTITNSDYQAVTKSIITPNDVIDLTGNVTGVGEIQKINVTYSSYNKEEASVIANGTNQWSCQIPLEIGTNAVTVSAYATDGAIAQAVVYINRTSESIKYKDTVKVADAEDYATIYNDAVACWCDDNGTALATDDTIVMLVREDALLLDQIEDGLLNPGDMYLIPDNDLFVVGFSGVYKLHRAPEGCPEFPADEYPDSQYEEIVFDYAGFADLFAEDVSLDFSAGVNTSDPIAFVMSGNGMPVYENGGGSELTADEGVATYANNYYGSPGWQPEQLFTSIIPSFNCSVDDYGRLNIQLKWRDVVIYDDDGKKNPDSGIEADKGQLKLSGEFGITNLKYTGGMEWHPSLVPWDIELLPQQIISKLEYTQGGGLELKGGVSVSTSDLIQKLNRGYKNQKEFWGMSVNGVKTFESRWTIFIVGVNLAPISVQTYSTIKGLAAASTMTAPKLFLYFFLDVDGNVTVEGSLGMKYSTDYVKGYNVQKNGYTGSYGSQAQNRSDKHYNIGATHTLDVYDTSNDNGGLELKLSGKLEAGLDVGGGFGAGLMICGVCPATVDGELFYRANGVAEGDIKFLPLPFDEDSIDGYAGLYHGIGLQADISARAILKTKIGDAGFDVNKHFEHMLWEDDLSTSKFDGTVYVADDDGDNSNNSVVIGASVKLTKKDTGKVWTATTNGNGKYLFGSLPDGEYSMLVEKEGFDSYTNSSIVFEKKKTLDVFLNEHNPWDGICVLSGKIVIADTDTDMTNNQALNGALIELRNNSNNAMTSTTTAIDGTYKFENIPAGNYTITISKEGYISIFAAVSVAENIQNYYNATMEAISEEYTGEGTASGTIYDALNGNAVAGLTLNFRGGIGTSSGTIVQTVATDSRGKYVTPYMPAGNYTAEIVDNRTLDNEDARYLTSTFSIKILGNQSIPNQNGFVTNGLVPDQLRIILKWGSSPRDLDSHLVGPSTSGGRFHTYYSNKDYYSSELMANLDLDDTDGDGPETTTIYETSPGIYTFLVHDYTNRSATNSSALANSGAYVEIFIGVSEIAVHRFDVPNLPGTLWTVFSYNANTGEILPINTMSYHRSATSSVGSSIPVQESAVFTGDSFAIDSDYEDPPKDYEMEEQNNTNLEETTEDTEEPFENPESNSGSVGMNSTDATQRKPVSEETGAAAPAENTEGFDSPIKTKTFYLSLGEVDQNYTWYVETSERVYPVKVETDEIYSVELPVDTDAIFLYGDDDEDMTISSEEILLEDIQGENCIVALIGEHEDAFEVVWGFYDLETQKVTVKVADELTVGEDSSEETVSNEETEEGNYD